MSARRFVIFAAALASLALAACGDERRSGGGGRRPGGDDPDTGSGITQPDATNNTPPDAGNNNTPNDAGPNLDATTTPTDTGNPIEPDSGTPEDAGVMPVSLRVSELQDETAARHPPMDTIVRVSNVIVSAVYTSGQNMGSFWIQEPAGGPYSGIFVYVEMPLIGMWTVTPGDRLTLVGRYTEYFELSEIVLQAIESQGPGAAPLPEDRSPFELSDEGVLAEAYEGVLVRVSSLQVTSSNPDAPMDFGEFEVTGGLRIDDALYRLDPRPLPGIAIDYITGVMNFSFSHRKLLPRDAFDIGPQH